MVSGWLVLVSFCLYVLPASTSHGESDLKEVLGLARSKRCNLQPASKDVRPKHCQLSSKYIETEGNERSCTCTGKKFVKRVIKRRATEGGRACPVEMRHLWAMADCDQTDLTEENTSPIPDDYAKWRVENSNDEDNRCTHKAIAMVWTDDLLCNSSNRVYPSDWQCDCIATCADNSDEAGCGQCSSGGCSDEQMKHPTLPSSMTNALALGFHILDGKSARYPALDMHLTGKGACRKPFSANLSGSLMPYLVPENVDGTPDIQQYDKFDVKTLSDRKDVLQSIRDAQTALDRTSSIQWGISPGEGSSKDYSAANSRSNYIKRLMDIPYDNEAAISVSFEHRRLKFERKTVEFFLTENFVDYLAVMDERSEFGWKYLFETYGTHYFAQAFVGVYVEFQSAMKKPLTETDKKCVGIAARKNLSLSDSLSEFQKHCHDHNKPARPIALDVKSSSQTLKSWHMLKEEGGTQAAVTRQNGIEICKLFGENFGAFHARDHWGQGGQCEEFYKKYMEEFSHKGCTNCGPEEEVFYLMGVCYCI